MQKQCTKKGKILIIMDGDQVHYHLN